MDVPDAWEITAAAKAKPKAPRKPEEVWYDVHKHPAGVPGGMGLSPEHHLRGRGWSGYEINEGSGKKTIQYRNQKFPDFVVSYGGGTATKPDHNFRVLYMGVNTNIPKVHNTYSVAEAMNKVEELHKLNNGLVVQPMIHDSAVAPSQQKQPGMVKVPKPAEPRDMTKADAYPQFPSQPEHERTWTNRAPQLKEIPDPPPVRAPKPGPTKAYSRAPEGPLARAFAAFRMAQQDNWEGDGEWPGDDTDYYHGTVEEDLDDVQPASQHGGRVTFRSDTDPDYAYVTTKPGDAWSYAEKAWHSSSNGVPRVYRVRATGPVEPDEFYQASGRPRSIYEHDMRSRHPFEVQEELPMPESMGDPEEWR